MSEYGTPPDEQSILDFELPEHERTPGAGRPTRPEWLRRLNAMLKLPDAWANRRIIAILMMLAIGLTWGILLTPRGRVDVSAFVPGEVAGATIRSPVTLVAEDAEATSEARRAAVERVLPVVDVDTALGNTLRRRIDAAFVALRQADALPDVRRRNVEQALAVALPDSVYDYMESESDNFGVELKLKDLVARVDELRIATEPQRWAALYPRGVQLRWTSENGEQIEMLSPSSYDRVLQRSAAVEVLRGHVKTRYRESSRLEREMLGQLIGLLVEPNLRPNPNETGLRQQAAEEAVKPVLFQLKAGEVVVRAGERVTPAQHKRLSALSARADGWTEWAGRIARIALGALIVVLLMPWDPGRRWRMIGHPQDLLFLWVLSALLLAIIRGMGAVAEPLMLAVPELPRQATLLLAPFATMGMVARLFYRERAAFTVAIMFGLVVGLFLEPILLVMPLAILGGAVGAQRLQHSKRRSQFHVAGAIVGLVQAGVWIAYGWMDPAVDQTQMLAGIPVAFGGGLLAAVVAAALLPLGELVGRYVSEARLIELAQDDQPLLRWLHLNAPGTYNHSISVGRLAEAACERTGADALLARVGAYYHDIGKATFPAYFVENQSDYNRHDGMNPSMSARYILHHVSRGVALAQEHDLPEVLVDFIREHHGRSRIEFFYRKACEEAGRELDDQAFRYPGPRPRTKESAIVMLADSVESAMRTLQDPTPERIREFVEKLVHRIYTSRELDDAPLSLRDLKTATDAFTQVLIGMHHRRIDYPLGLKPVDTRVRRAD